MEEVLNTQPEELSLRDELAKNLQEVTVEQPPEKTPAPQETPAEAESRARDEKGRFAAKEVQPPPTGQEQPTATAGRPPRPSSWKKEYWEKWDKIAETDPELASYLNQREGQFASGVSTYKQEWEQAKPLIDAIAPYQPILQQNGIEPAQFISNLANAHHKMTTAGPQEKIAMLQKLAADYGVPVQLAVQGQNGWQLIGQQQPMQQFDPSIIPKLVQQELMQASTKQQLEAFTQEAPTKYPHFEVVKQTMAGLLQAGLADDLPSAYDAALRHPRHADLFEQMQQQQSEQQAAEAKAAQQQKVQRARSNAVSTRSSIPSGTVKAVGEKGLREEIAENFRAIAGGRV